MNDPTDDGNDGRYPNGVGVLTPFPVTDEQAAGDRASWPWVAATVVSQCGDEWTLAITAPEAITDDDGARYHPVVFRDSSEIRLPDPTVEELRQIFFEEHGGAL